MGNIKDKLKAQVWLNAGILLLSLVAIVIAEGVTLLFNKQPCSFKTFLNNCSNADLVFAIFTAECTNICWRFLDQDKVRFSEGYLIYILIYCLVVVTTYIVALAIEGGVPQLVQWVFISAVLCYIFDVRIIYNSLKRRNRRPRTSQSAGYTANKEG